MNSLTCYRFIAIPASFITLVLSFVLWQSGTLSFLVMTLWTKVITTALLLLFAYLFRIKQFYFFNNLGFSNPSIYVSVTVIDFMMAGLSFTLALLL